MRAVMAALLAIGHLVSAPQMAMAAPPPWYPPLQWVPASPANYEAGRAGAAIRYIVIHATDGSYAGALSWFRDPASGLSAHYVVRASDGEVTQTVTEADTAFHARGFNRESIGIEHEHDPRNGTRFTVPQYHRSAILACAIARRYSIPIDRAHIVAHSEVGTSDHTDPGPTWNWDYYMGLVRSCAGSSGATTVSAVCDNTLCLPPAGLARGTSGRAVAALQLGLVYLGLLRGSDVATGEGIFGPRTEAALRAFQSAHGVPSTGYYGPLSAAALGRALAGGATAAPAASATDAPAVDLELGDSSAAVADLQRALVRRGYMELVTGYFGPVTLDAVRRFQADHGIVATGYYGPLTRRALTLH